MNNIFELIQRRRLQILVHSCIYYELNENIISDELWSKWALELENLQIKYPGIADKVMYADEFKNFDHSTGASLGNVLRYPEIVHKAEYLLNIKRKEAILCCVT